jgi:hypothetical protein
MPALLEKDRNRMDNEFRKILGEEATQAMLSQFPTRDVDELVTKDYLDKRFAEFKVDMTGRMLGVAGLGLAYLTVIIAIFR